MQPTATTGQSPKADFRTQTLTPDQLDAVRGGTVIITEVSDS